MWGAVAGAAGSAGAGPSTTQTQGPVQSGNTGDMHINVPGAPTWATQQKETISAEVKLGAAFALGFLAFMAWQGSKR